MKAMKVPRAAGVNKSAPKVRKRQYNKLDPSFESTTTTTQFQQHSIAEKVILNNSESALSI